MQAFDAASAGEERVIPAGSVNVKNISRDFDVLCKRASVTRYDKPLHTLRKSCITDWASRFPMHAVQEWAGHANIQTTRVFYLKVGEAEYDAAARQPFATCTQLGTQPADSDRPRETAESVDPGESDTSETAGEGIRTLDVQLGKLRFKLVSPPLAQAA